MKSRRDFGNDNDLAAADLLGGWHTRFVDAVVWAEAACQRMDFKPGEYVKAHKDNKDVAFRVLAENEPICIGIRKLYARDGYWEGYPRQLCAAIQPYVDEVPNEVWLARRLPLFIPILDKVYGIKIVMHKRLEQNDNRNGIIIGVGRGKYFQTPTEASGREEIPTQPASGLLGKKFLRRI